VGSRLSPEGWIFDLDGTLTVPMHDFAGFKSRMGLPPHLDILAGIALQPVEARGELHAAVVAWEESMVDDAVAAPGAESLLRALEARPRGVVTRNTKEHALRTLKTIGLHVYFHDDDVLGRGCATPKPAPDALRHLLTRWNLSPGDAIMVGDYIDDVRAGQAAGVITASVGGPEEWGADHAVSSLVGLLPLVSRSS
jgi:HAD superfamily hydrolase (TIGR01509 family)